MINTDCEKCIHLKTNSNTNGRFCAKNQFVSHHGEKYYTYGYCRDFDKVETQKPKQYNIHVLIPITYGYTISDIIQKCETLKKDMGINKFTVFSYDEKIENKEDIKKLLNNSINYNHQMTESKSLTDRIHQVSETIKDGIFMVIPSYGGLEINLSCIEKYLLKDKSRFVFWYFQNKIFDTIMCDRLPVYGIYIKEVFDRIYDKSGKTFFELLQKSESDILLSCMIDGVYKT